MKVVHTEKEDSDCHVEMLCQALNPRKACITIIPILQMKKVRYRGWTIWSPSLKWHSQYHTELRISDSERGTQLLQDCIQAPVEGQRENMQEKKKSQNSSRSTNQVILTYIFVWLSLSAEWKFHESRDLSLLFSF